MSLHTFHIPVMGVGFTIDSPLKVAQYGIDSVIALADDMLFEKLRKNFCSINNINYVEISNKVDDFRAKRITAYLNLIQTLVEKKYEEFIKTGCEKKSELIAWIQMLPDGTRLKREFSFAYNKFNKKELLGWLRENLSMGNIDVNIMTKVDKENFKNKEKLPIEYNDAHSALRGFAKSNLSSSVVLSAGLNPRLYGYIQEFEGFYPKEDGTIEKKITLKVSDYRSALVQAKFLAKKGLWVSEYRIESGLNCGGHAFATNGLLLGPILHEFRSKKVELINSTFDIYTKALKAKGKIVPEKNPNCKISVQGGVGSAQEHQFLLEHYGVNSVGWGSPFLLVPEATTVDHETLVKLAICTEKDLYLSNISPLGVPFNNLKGNTKDRIKGYLINKGRPGSSCPKKYLALNKEFNQQGMCTASRQYQYLKLKELKKQKLPDNEYQIKYDKIVEKSCICVGLGTTALLTHNIDTKVEGEGVSVCPGPNMAYFTKIISLKKMIGHIYGKNSGLIKADRPNMFVKELDIYIQYLKTKFEESIKQTFTKKQKSALIEFSENLNHGLNYYLDLFKSSDKWFKRSQNQILLNLAQSKLALNSLDKAINASVVEP